MSQRCIERVRAAVDAYNRCDFDAVVENSELEVVPPGGQAIIKGAARVRAWMEPDAFESQVVEPLHFRVAGNKVLVQARTKIRGAGSGIEAEFLVWQVWTFNEAGLTTRIEIYLEHQEAEALEAAGLGDSRSATTSDSHATWPAARWTSSSSAVWGSTSRGNPSVATASRDCSAGAVRRITILGD